MHFELLLNIEIAAESQRSLRWSMTLLSLPVKILFDDSTGFHAMMWTTILQQQ